MHTSPKGVAYIAMEEGIVTQAYKGVDNVWTIGVGHTAAAGGLKPARGMKITRQQALNLLADDLPKYESGVVKRLGLVGQLPFDGAVSFHFNTGAIAKASWVAKYLAKDYRGAEASLKTWVKSRGKVIKGLVSRRGREADIMFRGTYPKNLDLTAIAAAAPAADANPAASTASDDVKSYQSALLTLGKYAGPIDGLPATSDAAVRKYQAEHPDLVVDGVVGPATRAQLERDLKARQTPVVVAAGEAAAAVASQAADAVGINPWVVGIVIAIAVLGVGFLLWRRYRR